jgi:hypothetical protein
MRARLEAARRPSPSEDPFEPLSNLVASDESDLAARVDEYLYR